MSQDVAVTVRIQEEYRVLWKELAAQDGRSLGNYIERLLMKEKEFLNGNRISLELIKDRLDRIGQKLDQLED